MQDFRTQVILPVCFGNLRRRHPRGSDQIASRCRHAQRALKKTVCVNRAELRFGFVGSISSIESWRLKFYFLPLNGFQLAIEYAPNPIFHSGTPESATAEVLKSFQKKYEPIGAARETAANRYAAEGTPARQTSSRCNPQDSSANIAAGKTWDSR
jgi:hypothetical protein